MFRLRKKWVITAFIAAWIGSLINWQQDQCEGGAPCLASELSVNWRQWALGSDSSQIHFVELLELLYRPARDAWSE